MYKQARHKQNNNGIDKAENNQILNELRQYLFI